MEKRVPLITRQDGVKVPQLPDGAGYVITKWHIDGTVTVKLDERTELRMLIEETTE